MGKKDTFIFVQTNVFVYNFVTDVVMSIMYTPILDDYLIAVMGRVQGQGESSHWYVTAVRVSHTTTSKETNEPSSRDQ